MSGVSRNRFRPLYSTSEEPVMSIIGLGFEVLVSTASRVVYDVVQDRTDKKVRMLGSLKPYLTDDISKGIYRSLVRATLHRCDAELSKYNIRNASRRKHRDNVRTARWAGVDVEAYLEVADWADNVLHELDSLEGQFLEAFEVEIDPMGGFKTSASDDLESLAQAMKVHVATQLSDSSDAEEEFRKLPDSIFTTKSSADVGSSDQGRGDTSWGGYYRRALRECFKNDRGFREDVHGSIFASMEELLSGQTSNLEEIKSKQQEIIELLREELEGWRVEAYPEQSNLNDTLKSRTVIHNDERSFHLQWNPNRFGSNDNSFKIFGRDRINVWEEGLRNKSTQLLVIYGEGGLGKSTVIEALWERLSPESKGETSSFDLTVAVSMEYNRPCSAAQIAEAVIPTIAPKKEGSATVADLANAVQENSVLFILDGLEYAMKPNGEFKKEYRDLHELIDVLIRSDSNACTIIGSRTFPQLLRKSKLNRMTTVQLEGLAPSDALAAIEQDLGDSSEGLITKSNRSKWKKVVAQLGGNPFVCFHVARQILNTFRGNPGAWLERSGDLPQDAQAIYEWHWDRLEEQPDGLKEREILLWLALSLKPVATEELKSDLWSSKSRRQFENSLERLQRRFSLKESNKGIFPHSYITEFSARQVVDLSASELTVRLTGEHARGQVIQNVSDQLRLDEVAFKADVEEAFYQSDGPTGRVLIDHCLVKASASAPIRDLQRRTFVNPILNELKEIGYEVSELQSHLRHLLEVCAEESWGGYLAGNLLTLLRSAGNGLIENVNAPNLRIRQLDLRSTEFQNSDLNGGRFQEVYFTQKLGEVRTLALSPLQGTQQDRRHLAVGDDIGAVTVWSVGEETPEFRHNKHDGATVRAVAFSPDGNCIASADNNGQVWLWNSWMTQHSTLRLLETEQGPPRDLHGDAQLRSLAFIADGQLLTSSESPTVWLHDLERQEARVVFDLNLTREAESKPALKRVHVLYVHGDQVYAGTKNGRIYQIGSVQDYNEDAPPFREVSIGTDEYGQQGDDPCHEGSVFAIAVSKDGTTLATGGTDGAVHIWDVDTLQHLKSYDHGDEVFSLAFLNETSFLASGGEDGSIAIWDLQRERLERRLIQGKHTEGHLERVRALASGNVPGYGPVFCSGGFDRKLIQWGRDATPLNVIEGYANGVSGLDSLHGETVVASYESGEVLKWEAVDAIDTVDDIDNMTRYRSNIIHEENGPIYCVASDTENKWVVSGGRSGAIKATVLDSSEEPLEIKRAHEHWVWSVDISADGKQIASCSEDERVNLWNIPLSPTNAEPVTCVGEGERLEASGVSHGDRARIVRYHPESSIQLLASGGYDRAVRFWDTGSGSQVGLLEGAENWIFALDFSDKWFAAAWGRGDIRIWNIRKLLSCGGSWATVPYSQFKNVAPEPRNFLTQEEQSDSITILSLRFLSDSHLLAGGTDKRVQLWRRTGNSWSNPENISTFEHDYDVTSICLLEGGRVCSGDAGGYTFIWRPDDPEQTAISLSPSLPYQNLDLSRVRRVGRQESTLSEGERQTLAQLGASV